MEASFVRTMLENNSPLLRLDRYLPDSSESTLDLKSQRKKKHGTPGKNKTPSGLLAAPEILLVHQEQEWRVELIRDQQGGFHPTISIMILRKIRWSHRLISELMIKMNDKDERDLPYVAVAPPMAPAN
ncbi:hypothetical protein DKX38_023202 [Salix brachista]|uniref:Uncharacterized protein n=1 Tax=Salix brachista TaxID=2182728 RepID=A0A5N5K652_9ROSI|nr:hypothetical protein DKX38_023202 [Salix brachista]